MEAKANSIRYSDAMNEIFVNVREIYRSPNFCWKVFWCLVFVFLLVICGCNIFSHTHMYFSFPVTTVVDEKSYETLPFPKVTICFENWLKWAKFYQNYPNDTNEWVASHFLRFYKYSNASNFEAAKELYGNATNGGIFDVQNFLRNYSYTCEEFFPAYGCQADDSESEAVNCCKYAQPFYHNGFMCFMLNLPFVQMEDGYEHKMSVKVRGKQGKSEKTKSCSFSRDVPSERCLLGISLSDKKSDVSISVSDYFFTTESFVTVEMHARRVTKMSYPYGNCEEMKLKYFKKYSKDLCKAEKRVEEAMKIFGCVPLSLLMHRQDEAHLPICDPIQMVAYSKQGAIQTSCPRSCSEHSFAMEKSFIR